MSVLEPWVMESRPDSQVGPLQDRLAGLTTHMSVWPASSCLAKWLEVRQVELGFCRPGFRLLELGSGTGWLGRVLAANLPLAGAIVVSERPEAMERLSAHCDEFVRARRTSMLRAESLDWRLFDPALAMDAHLPDDGYFDLVIGSDLVWNSETASSLPHIIKALIHDSRRQGGKTMVLYGHWNRSPKFVTVFLEICEAVGLAVGLYESPPTPSAGGTSAPSPLSPECEDRPAPGRAKSVQSSSDTESDVDWTAQIFPESISDQPIFSVYTFSLRGE